MGDVPATNYPPRNGFDVRPKPGPPKLAKSLPFGVLLDVLGHCFSQFCSRGILQAKVPKQVLLIYFRPQHSYHLHTWSSKVFIPYEPGWLLGFGGLGFGWCNCGFLQT